MIATEAEYKETMIVINDLRKQYKNLSGIDRNRPYIGQQMARDIHRLAKDAKQWENDRPKKLTGATEN